MAEILNEVYLFLKLAAFGGGAWVGIKLIAKAVIRSRVNRVASAMYSLGPSTHGMIYNNVTLDSEDTSVTLMRLCSKGLARKVGNRFELTPEGETIIGHEL